MAEAPTEDSIRAAEELELNFDGDHDDPDKSRVDDLRPVHPSRSPSLSHDDSATATLASNKTSPSKSPSKVKAAAVMWETASNHSNNPSPRNPRPNLSSSSSFRSIPASASMSTTRPILSKGDELSPAESSADSALGASASSLAKTPKIASQAAYSQTTPQSRDKRESFAEVMLDDVPVGELAQDVSNESRSYHLSPVPPPADLSADLPDPVTTPPVSDPPAQKSSFFSSALGFGLPTSTSKAIPTESKEPSPPMSRSVSSNAAATSGPSWRSTMSTLLGSRSISTATPAASPSTIATGSAAPTDVERNSSTSFLLQHMASPTASRDRRISREVGAMDRLREGFERVRNEMEDAAREMRKEGKSPASPAPDSPGGVDWVFWGAVVQDYEEVARQQPKELSRAIQQGVPAVIRGAIWQLMSSSKSAPLEETYKALLKLPSPHDKAIVKDISRTFPNHKYFQQGGGAGQESLYMVVKAYSLYDQEVGYTQGLAFIVAALLLNMPDEEAFCVLVRLMDSYNLRSHFLADMPGLQLRLFQFDRLVEELLPLLHTHFVKKGVKSSMFASQWFMTLFSYRFPLSLVYRVLDIVFAEGIEAIFRFSLALLTKSEDKLVELEFEQILSYLQTDLFESYRIPKEGPPSPDGDHVEEDWRANDFVRDAYDVRITPFMLDSYESEYEEQCREQNKHALELDQLRNANRNLSAQVKQLEASLSTINQEHVELVRQLVMSKIDKEETENELVRYKMLYAELAHAQQDAMSTHSRFSAGSSMSQMQ